MIQNKYPGGHQCTCAKQQQDFHYGVFLKGELEPDELKADLVHALTQLIHGRQVHLLSAKQKGQTSENMNMHHHAQAGGPRAAQQQTEV